MVMLLLGTKLYIPSSRPDLVARPRLLQALSEGLCLGHKLTLVSAPAGFGKTTLLSEWISQSEAKPRVAWLSLDAGDNDLTRFLTYLVAALQTVEGNVGQGLLAALQSPGTVNVEAVLTSLTNEITELQDGLAGGGLREFCELLDTGAAALADTLLGLATESVYTVIADHNSWSRPGHQ